MACRPPLPQRLYFLDWLRVGAFGLLVLYHVGMYYLTSSPP
jgi:glucans biosynthesis protein C